MASTLVRKKLEVLSGETCRRGPVLREAVDFLRHSNLNKIDIKRNRMHLSAALYFKEYFYDFLPRKDEKDHGFYC